MENKNQSFEYTYSAVQQEEIEKIRAKYAVTKDNKLEKLRKLDAMVTNKATMMGIFIGVIGCLLFGSGLSIVLMADKMFLMIGILLGIVGMGIMGGAYPIYQKVLEKERAQIAPQILSLIDELDR